MATSCRSKSKEPERSVSPSGRFCSSSISTSSSISGFSSPPSGLLTRSASPSRVNLRGTASMSPSVRFSIDRPATPGRSISMFAMNQKQRSKASSGQKKACMCSPTTHPGSFRCRMHRSVNNQGTLSYHSNGLNARRSAMTNSLVRIGAVEGDLVKRALAALIRPSSHQQRRRSDFQPRPSRLSIMSKAEDEKS